MDALNGRRIALGVGGSIAAYKALDIASQLTQAGVLVDVLLTRAGGELVRPLAFQAITHRPVVGDLWAPQGALGMDHVAVARAAEALLVAPATADLLARLALGLADDALTTTALAHRGPLLIAPAMEPRMWAHPATQGHVATLRGRGARMVGPVEGRLASGATGLGRMAEPEAVVAALRQVLAPDGPLRGRSVLVTAGPTREPIDPVRYLSNHSSGRMGLALAAAARDRGAAVTLLHGPIGLPLPDGVRAQAVETAAEMAERVLDLAPRMDVLVMAAAVADYRPQTVASGKLKKHAASLTLQLERNPDILELLDARLAGAVERPMRVGFAAETEDLLANARAKLARKGLDLIVANPVPESFAGETSTATLLDAAGVQALAPSTKAEVAAAILDRVAAWLAARRPAGTAPDGSG
jgi:phosphopantothenoylcysteine decarboxylase/phosphopantothenate--cysteine ligase